MRTKPSVRSRLLEWLLWRLPLKSEFAKTDGLRNRVLKSRPKSPRPPRSFYRRFKVEETMQDGQRVFTLSPRKGPAKLHVLYLHGGAYVYQIMGTQWRMMAQLLKRMDLAITIPLYPLAPEHTCT
ncbi:MAG: alpha/beta hydrolase, partial [Janthinobacterium lividum]